MAMKRLFLQERGRHTAAWSQLSDTAIDAYEPVEHWLAANEIPARFMYTNSFTDVWLDFDSEEGYVEFVLRWL